MFNKKDYASYFKQLYAIELDMKREAQKLLKIIEHPEARVLLKKIVADEIRHAKIVKDMTSLIYD